MNPYLATCLALADVALVVWVGRVLSHPLLPVPFKRAYDFRPERVDGVGHSANLSARVRNASAATLGTCPFPMALRRSTREANP